MTKVKFLTDIIASGGLIPRHGRKGDHMHGWGSNEDLGGKLVCLSRAPSWGIMNQFDGDAPVILSFDQAEIMALPDVRPCPMNSAKARARGYLDGSVDREVAAAECAKDEVWKEAEVLVRDAVPTGLIRVITFHDRFTLIAWRRAVIETSRSAEAGLSPSAVLWHAAPGRQPRFPPDLVADPGQPQLGRDLRLTPTPVRETVGPVDPDEAEWIDPEEFEEEHLVDEEHGDLFEQLYGSHPIDRSIADFYEDEEIEL